MEFKNEFNWKFKKCRRARILPAHGGKRLPADSMVIFFFFFIGISLVCFSWPIHSENTPQAGVNNNSNHFFFFVEDAQSLRKLEKNETQNTPTKETVKTKQPCNAD